MNANELADALQETEPYYSTDYKLFDQAAIMLRQQQAEIEALKKYFEAWMFLNNGMIELGTKARSMIKEKQNDYSE